MSYKDEGIVPEAFRNFLALLGWTPENSEKEILGDKELIAAFSLENISHSNAVFDRAKLDWFNTEYIRAYPSERLLPLIRHEWEAAGVKPQVEDESKLLSIIDLLKPRARNLKDFANAFRGYFTDDYQTDPAAVEKFLKDPSTRTMLAELADRYAAATEFTEQSTEQVLRDFAAEKDVKAGALINGSRVALTGQAVAPSLFAVIVALGKEKTLRRLRNAPLLGNA
jgi:glutamyl-tRNA synthetase